jgi:(2R)-3-sulfolactate dehydrogenase (NADP+)
LLLGGYKGGNIALLVEVLSTLSGGAFSIDAPPFTSGAASPSIGVTVVAVATEVLNPGYLHRLDAQLEHWRAEHGANPDVWTAHHEAASCSVPRDVYEQLQSLAGVAAGDPADAQETR